MTVMLPVAVGILIGVTIWMICDGRTERTERLSGLSPSPARPSSRIGIVAVLSSITSFVRNGGTVVEAFEELAERTYPSPTITVDRAMEIFDAKRSDDETEERAWRVAVNVTMACQVSELLGCETARCLSAVSAAYRRECLMEASRSQALAMPESTMKLLAALPVVTVMLGEIMGASPLTFLFGSLYGWLCLLGGLTCYGIGLLWIDALTKPLRDDAEVQRDGRA
ncbi:type II secretion system F family protein [Bifidobacterium callimiconis]|nr:pilus assembly protein [Bifidobacterium callimiconis]